MNLSTGKRWRRAFLLTGMGLCLAAGIVYGVERVSRDFSLLLNQADTHYQAQRYPEAIAAYKRALHRTTTLPVRIMMLLLMHPLRPASLALQIANCHYRLAEAELRHYQQAAGDPRVTPRPSLGTVRRVLAVAEQAYAEVPKTYPRAYMAAQVNGARVAAWQLILAAFDEETSGRRSLRQQALQAINHAARAVDYGHRHEAEISRRERLHAMLLLETLTAFSQEKPPPTPPRPPHEAWHGRLGDVLLQNRAELSSQDRQRFREFFFALPFEAKEPWPTAPWGAAGGNRSPVAH